MPRFDHQGERGGAHLLVEKDPVEVCWGGEELVLEGEFTGGNLDAGVDWSSCAARGRNLLKTTRRKPLMSSAAALQGDPGCAGESFRAVGRGGCQHRPAPYPPWPWPVSRSEAWPRRWLWAGSSPA